MDTLATDIVWAGNWTHSQRRVARPFVVPVISFAEEATAYVGAQATSPKRALIMRVGDNHPTYGSAVDDLTLELHLSAKIIKRKKLEQRFLTTALSATHERAHCVRSESFDDENSLRERAATEGIACHIEGVIAREMMSEVDFLEEYKSDYDDLASDLERKLRSQFNRDADTAEAAVAQLISGATNDRLQEQIDDIHEKWFDLNPINGIAFGDKLGIMSVGRLLNDGATFPEILQLPSREIMAA